MISVIIPTYNEKEHIQTCLESLIKQTYKQTEIIVVDDNSSDDTIDIVKQFHQIKLLTQRHQGPGTARNLGVQKSRGEILVFVDADMKLHPKFIDKLTLPIRQNKTIGTFTKDERVANSDNPWARSWSQIRGFQKDRMHPTNYPDQQPVYRAIKRKIFLENGGFKTDRGYDDDWTLYEKIGQMAINAPGAIIYHYNPASIREIFHQARWMAKRKYKLGFLGKFAALARASLPVTKLKALYRLFKFKSLHTFAATFVVDFGITYGLIESFINRKTSK